MTTALAALWHPFPIFLAASLVCAVGYCALVDQARRRDDRRANLARALQEAIEEAEAERVADEFLAHVDAAIDLVAGEITDADREFADKNGVLL